MKLKSCVLVSTPLLNTPSPNSCQTGRALVRRATGPSLQPRRWLACGAALITGLVLAHLNIPLTLHAASVAESLEKAIYTEETKGDVPAAIGIYQQIVDDPRADRDLVAQAQLRLGLCQLKLGNKPQAIVALDRLTQEFPDKDKLLAAVERQMPQVLDEIVQQIERNYIQEVDRGELIETAIRAIVGRLDSRGGFLRPDDLEFLTPDQLKDMNVQMEQKLAGVGAVLRTDNGDVIVQSLLPGSPALSGGLQPGDRIITINDSALRPNNLAAAVQLLRGPGGTKVKLGIRRGESEELLELTLTRANLRLATVHGARRRADRAEEFMLDDQKRIGFVRISQLGQQTAEELHAALSDLTARGLQALILDLRNNPGGLLDASVAVADLFLESGRIVTVKGRDGETAYAAKPEGTFTNFSMVVLINRQTASAAEIVAAALQDHHRAVVIGERTFGQGIVRSIFQLKSGVGAVKIPIAVYFRPNGNSMNRYPDSKDTDIWGVQPDDGFVVVGTGAAPKPTAGNGALRGPARGPDDDQRDVLLQDPALPRALEWIEEQLSKK